MQVAAEDLAPGEDRKLRLCLRQLEARRSSVERAGLVHSALSGDGGVGGLDDMLRSVRGHLQAIAEQEQAFSALAGQLSSSCRRCGFKNQQQSLKSQHSVVCPRGWGAGQEKWAARPGHLEGLAVFLHFSAARHQLCRAGLPLSNVPGKHLHSRTAAAEGRADGLQAVMRQLMTLQMRQRQTLTQITALRMLRQRWQQ